MLLAVDIGNSEITIGVWLDSEWIQHWRLSSKKEQQAPFYTFQLRERFLESGIDLEKVQTVVLSSVVPALTKIFQDTLKSLFEIDIVTLNPEVYKRLPIQVLNPFEIGSDLVANAMAAFTKFKQTCIVVDFGTALTFTTVSKEGTILGVSIAPGLQTAIRSLSENTAKLFEVPLEMPASSLGRSTVTAIQSGVLFGYEGLVKSVVGHIRAELNTECIAVAAGGLSSVITSLNDFFYSREPRLTLDGLRYIGQIVAAKNPVE